MRTRLFRISMSAELIAILVSHDEKLHETARAPKLTEVLEGFEQRFLHDVFCIFPI
jgi:hypothetical protein